MNRHFLKLIGKISLITFVLVFVIGLGPSLVGGLFASSNDEKNIIKTNENSFQNASNPILGKTGIALAVNLGTRYTAMNELPVNLYTEAITIGQLMSDKGIIYGGIISSNMALINEYRNVLKTDIKGLISTSLDRAQMLDSIISQFQYRHNLAIDQIRGLIMQRTSFQAEMTTKENSISALKIKIRDDFTKGDSTATYENMQQYIELQNEHNYARTYVVFINQLLNDYAVLNEYTKNLVDILTKNKDAIIKNSYVVIPEGGVELLRDFDLLYNTGESINR